MTSPWRYRRPAAAEIVEWGDVLGCAVALPTHFHDEDQVTFVLAGRRRFRVADEWVSLAPGEGVALPAGTPHGSRDEPAGVHCRNAYLPAGTVALPDLVAAASRLWRRGGGAACWTSRPSSPSSAIIGSRRRHRSRSCRS